MVKCLNINNPIIQEKLNQLTEILGNADAAYAVLALNNGYGLESTPTGEHSILFDNILTQIRANNPSADQN